MHFSGHLAFLLSTGEITFVSSLVKNSLTTYKYIWIGLHDPSHVRSYLCLDFSHSAFYPWGRFPVTPQKTQMGHRSPMLDGIKAREIATKELSSGNLRVHLKSVCLWLTFSRFRVRYWRILSVSGSLHIQLPGNSEQRNLPCFLYRTGFCTFVSEETSKVLPVVFIKSR